ncbi:MULTISPECIES: hypothetical protein [unclassified Gilliamella]|nr:MULTISPECIES: hypothetical protein [unclassified Gilliamella]
MHIDLMGTQGKTVVYRVSINKPKITEDIALPLAEQSIPQN